MFATRVLRSAGAGATGQTGLKHGVRRDPELIPLFALVAGFIGFAGYFGEYKGWNKGADERDTSVIQMVPRREGSMITEHGMTKKMVPDGNFTFRIKPSNEITMYTKKDPNTKGDPTKIPTALHSITVPNVSLPKELHDKFNKYDKQEFKDY